MVGRLLAATVVLAAMLVSTERIALTIALLSMVISIYAVWLVRRSGRETLAELERQTSAVRQVKSLADTTEARLRGDDD